MDSLDLPRTMMAVIGFHRPVYLLDMFGESQKQPALTAAERDFAGYIPSTIAFTSPTCDLWFRTGALAKQWRGRGFCCVYARSPESRTSTQVLGSCLHEAGHFLTYASRPDRDDDDAKQAMAYSTANPCNAGEPHGERWLKACVHLWQRACAAGYDVPFGNVVDLDQYRLSRSQFAAALSESQAWQHLSIHQVEQKLAGVPEDQPKRRTSVLLVNGRLQVAA